MPSMKTKASAKATGTSLLPLRAPSAARRTCAPPSPTTCMTMNGIEVVVAAGAAPAASAEEAFFSPFQKRPVSPRKKSRKPGPCSVKSAWSRRT